MQIFREHGSLAESPGSSSGWESASGSEFVQVKVTNESGTAAQTASYAVKGVRGIFCL